MQWILLLILSWQVWRSNTLWQNTPSLCQSIATMFQLQRPSSCLSKLCSWLVFWKQKQHHFIQKQTTSCNCRFDKFHKNIHKPVWFTPLSLGPIVNMIYLFVQENSNRENKVLWKKKQQPPNEWNCKQSKQKKLLVSYRWQQVNKKEQQLETCNLTFTTEKHIIVIFA